MTKEEIENNAAEYLKTLTPDGWDDFENQPTYNAVQLVKAIYHGYEQGYEDCRHYAHDYYKPKWHDLRKNPNDLPKCTENELIIFYVQEYYKGIEKYINHYCLGFYSLGFYKKSFMDDDVKLFVERSKGYECEHSTEEVLCWCVLPKFEE